MSPVLLDTAEFSAACLDIIFDTQLRAIEEKEGLLLLYTAIASHNWAILVRFPYFHPLQRKLSQNTKFFTIAEEHLYILEVGEKTKIIPNGKIL